MSAAYGSERNLSPYGRLEHSYGFGLYCTCMAIRVGFDYAAGLLHYCGCAILFPHLQYSKIITHLLH
jgi:hypothetical protein